MNPLDIARALIGCGIPIFVAHPALEGGTWNPRSGHGKCGYWLPTRWQNTIPDPTVLDGYRPGDALCMVTGHGIDVVDTDPRNGGDTERAGLDAAGIMPTVYGRTATPSDGTHELVASLKVHKGTPRPGIDVQAGDLDGRGRGFVFLPPTRKAAKDGTGTITDTIGEYRWELCDLDRWAEDHDTDDSGDALAELVARSAERDRLTVTGEPGPEYTAMPDDQQASVDRWIAAALDGIAADLRAAKDWPVGHRDDHGRGWEKLTADACHRLGALARAPWNALGYPACWELVQINAPTDDTWTAGDLAGKWRAQRGRGNADALPDALTPAPAGDSTGGGTTVVTITTRTHGQLHIAERFEAEHDEKLIHVHGIGWLHWDGTRWTEDQHGHALRAVRRTLRKALAESANGRDLDLRKDVAKCETSAGMGGVLAIAASAECFAKTVDDLDADPYLINCANGTLDLHTMQIRPHDPADLITKVCRGAYRPGAVSPLWTEFLDRVLPDLAVREFLQRYAGLALAGVCLEHLLAILTGIGRNGKTVWYEAVRHALGDYAAMAEPDLFLHKEGAHPTGEVDLLGRRLVIVSENDRGRKLAEATVKRLTGGDRIKARRLYRDFIEFDPSHTPVLVTNFKPTARGDDAALWARLVVVPFEIVIPDDEQDPELGERLRLEADAILAWAVAGWVDYREGGMRAPAKVTEATGDYAHESDTVGRFIEDRCTATSPAQRVSVPDLFEEWMRWCASEGEDPGTKRGFNEAVRRAGFSQLPPSSGRRFWEGIGLQPKGGGESKNMP
ncbi:hypothetical protein CJ179_50215 [Rhodococcus sp. ACS1]|uniref:DNA primase family protein n=1 Tax=Rhodococcus sp. ACS1 TaxID=2028570 RepID=UPI000BB0E339|nr:phage/plasmid primase, P4 family [Rhodococcus sp. ACS1]PBC35036.1 hypothetical protein CJ179_50215 [Rhodococcus sp. ACS1]